MREILFRGKCVDNGEWVCGDLLQDYVCTNKWICVYTVNSCIQPREVIPETVGQYTGLTDKNGTKIFEGDWVCVGSKLRSYLYCVPVEYDENYGEWSPFGTSDDAADLEYVEVSGNIHENP